MEFFYDVRIGTRTKAGNLNVLHSFVCKSLEKNEYKIRDYYQTRYLGLSIDVLRINQIVDITNEKINIPDPFENNDNELKSKIRDLEREIKKLQESKNSIFTMEIHSEDINVENKLLYKKVVDDYQVYVKSVMDLENGIKKEIIEKYSPFASSVSTTERMDPNNKVMKFQLNLKAKLF